MATFKQIEFFNELKRQGRPSRVDSIDGMDVPEAWDIIHKMMHEEGDGSVYQDDDYNNKMIDEVNNAKANNFQPITTYDEVESTLNNNTAVLDALAVGSGEELRKEFEKFSKFGTENSFGIAMRNAASSNISAMISNSILGDEVQNDLEEVYNELQQSNPEYVKARNALEKQAGDLYDKLEEMDDRFNEEVNMPYYREHKEYHPDYDKFFDEVYSPMLDKIDEMHSRKVDELGEQFKVNMAQILQEKGTADKIRNNVKELQGNIRNINRLSAIPISENNSMRLENKGSA